MSWYDYIACFFAGMFLANVVPHYVKGVCGDRFPTPFANPPGKGLSSPTVNASGHSSIWSSVTSCFASERFRAETNQRLSLSSQASSQSAQC
jgi:hypothetical protein